MTSKWRWLVYVVGSLLALLAFDCLLIHPAGRYQLVATQGFGTMKMDTTTGEVWHFTGENWERMK